MGMELIIQIIAGLIGGNAAGAGLKNLSLGTSGKRISGGLGGGPGGVDKGLVGGFAGAGSGGARKGMAANERRTWTDVAAEPIRPGSKNLRPAHPLAKAAPTTL